MERNRQIAGFAAGLAQRHARHESGYEAFFALRRIQAPQHDPVRRPANDYQVRDLATHQRFARAVAQDGLPAAALPACLSPGKSVVTVCQEFGHVYTQPSLISLGAHPNVHRFAFRRIPQQRVAVYGPRDWCTHHLRDRREDVESQAGAITHASRPLPRKLDEERNRQHLPKVGRGETASALSRAEG